MTRPNTDIAICVQIGIARNMLVKYCICFAISSILLCVATLIDRSGIAFGLWIATLLVELFMYPVTILTTDHQHQLTVHLNFYICLAFAFSVC